MPRTGIGMGKQRRPTGDRMGCFCAVSEAGWFGAPDVDILSAAALGKRASARACGLGFFFGTLVTRWLLRVGTDE